MVADPQLMKSSANMGISFALLGFGLLLLGENLPGYGRLISVGFFFGSPFTWLLFIFKISGKLMAIIAVISPYILIGIVTGYFWPIHSDQTSFQKLRSILTRFLGAVVVLWTVGLGIGLWAMANDS